MVEIRVKEVLFDNSLRLIGVTVALIVVLHLRYLQDRVVLDELLMAGSTASTVAAGIDLVVSITLILSTFSQHFFETAGSYESLKAYAMEVQMVPAAASVSAEAYRCYV